MQHIILLGDSIFDNAAYVQRGEPDIIQQLSRKLPQGWKATLRARDGSMTHAVKTQLQDIPRDASFLIVSVGGNDALDHQYIFNQDAESYAQVLLYLAKIQEEFQHSYHSMLETILTHGLPTAICSIYYPRFPDPIIQRMAIAGLSVFNDCIIREAFTFGLPLIDLRLICNVEEDYANPLEPSAHGGEKITDAILKVVTEFDSGKPGMIIVTQR
jgi:GDSL-like lipase/acylhydrolase family protein